LDNYFALQQLEPFGPGNPSPVFVARGVQLARPARTVGTEGKHLKLLIASPAHSGGTIEAVGFNLGALKSDLARWGAIDIAFQWVRNTWQEMRSAPDAVKLNLHLLAVKPSARRAADKE
jgi:single-stranded-DNA-specific exonuclease